MRKIIIFQGLLISKGRNFNLGTISAPETNQVMLWQLATGINITPLSHMLIGLRYRWVYLAEMEDFTDRSMHSFEISMGYEW